MSELVFHVLHLYCNVKAWHYYKSYKNNGSVLFTQIFSVNVIKSSLRKSVRNEAWNWILSLKSVLVCIGKKFSEPGLVCLHEALWTGFPSLVSNHNCLIGKGILNPKIKISTRSQSLSTPADRGRALEQLQIQARDCQRERDWRARDLSGITTELDFLSLSRRAGQGRAGPTTQQRHSFSCFSSLVSWLTSSVMFALAKGLCSPSPEHFFQLSGVWI